MLKGDAYPLPWEEDPINEIGNATYMSLIDLTKGYWQVPVAKENRDKTDFTTLYGIN